MNAARIRDLTFETVILKPVLLTVRADAKSGRELFIQNEKLRRMLLREEPNRLNSKSNASAPTKNEQKRRGKAHAQIGMQHKKVRKLLENFLVENIQARTGQLMSRKQARTQLLSFETALAEGTKKCLIETARMIGKPVPAKLPRPFSRLGQAPVRRETR
jgi:hypothetical protein